MDTSGTYQAPRQYNSYNKGKNVKKAQGAAGGAQLPAAKGKNKASASKGGAPVGGECFKCGREGHFQSECTFEPLCVICSAEGHTSANCPSRGKTLRLQSMGHAITGGGFYNIDVEPLRGSQAPGEVFAAIISFKGKPLSEEMLSDELKHLVDELWDWQVRKLSEVEFSVVFPSRETLRLSTGSGKLHLPLSKKDTTIREAFLAPKPSVMLPSTWVRLTGVPEDLMTKERLMAAFVMVGRPFEVDELSLKKRDTEPIRMRFHCRFPERIKGSIQVFVNGEGFTVGVQAEASPRGGPGGSGGPPKPPTHQDEDEDESDGFSTDNEWNRHRHRKNKDGDKAMEEATAKGKSTPAATTGKSHKGVAEAGQGSQSAPPPGMGTGTGTTGLKLDPHGTNLLGARPTLLPFPAYLWAGGAAAGAGWGGEWPGGPGGVVDLHGD
ncbi:hypothetical protein QYE76_012897 [Lolium multiflorum]|uniref:CCHC-type domain-containing protein n=1 Tax=Lolium multiflorum TaxID=4521 RepID=A0AAD8X5E0_LOLMU|nr:hypothetical protein QYE76_012897 [Lolium multiflorum]